MKLTPRQIRLLEIIIDEYMLTAAPVSSKEIIKTKLNGVSSATVRNDMAVLEKEGLLSKPHTSSGRIPSILGYKFYEANILKPMVDINAKNKLKIIFSQRNVSIDKVIDESVTFINQFLQLPSVTAKVESNELLKRIDLIQINEKLALIILVTSSGNITKTPINLDTDTQLGDIATCVRIFNDRLIDTPIFDICDKLNVIKELVRSKVHEYEFVLQQLIEKIFNFSKEIETNISGIKYIISQPEFKDIEKLKKVLSILEDTNIWKQIAYNQLQTGKTLITFGSEIGDNDVAVASTSIDLDTSTHKISIVGPTRMDYSQIKGLLEFLKEEIEKKWKQKK